MMMMDANNCAHCDYFPFHYAIHWDIHHVILLPCPGNIVLRFWRNYTQICEAVIILIICTNYRSFCSIYTGLAANILPVSVQCPQRTSLLRRDHRHRARVMAVSRIKKIISRLYLRLNKTWEILILLFEMLVNY